MSRIGKKPISIPEGVTIEVRDPRIVSVQGVKGSLEYKYNREIQVEVDTEKKQVSVTVVQDTKKTPAYWGTTARIIANMIHGVAQGFEKKLELNGVGYRMTVKGKALDLALGFSHPVVIDIPEGLEVAVENNILSIKGSDKQQVGQFAAEIRSLRPVEPYKGKGFKYSDEIVKRKEGKRAGAGA